MIVRSFSSLIGRVVGKRGFGTVFRLLVALLALIIGQTKAVGDEQSVRNQFLREYEPFYQGICDYYRNSHSLI